MSFIIKQPAAGGRIHVHLVEKRYNPTKKGGDQIRTHLGVLDSGSNELILAKGRPEPGGEIKQLLKEKGIEYRGRRSQGSGRKRIRPLKGVGKVICESRVEEIGRLYALRQLCESSGLSICLKEGFGEETGEKIFHMAVYQACEKGGLYLAGEWLEEMGIEKGFSSSSISRLCGLIGKKQRSMEEFFKRWLNINGKVKTILHDTTSISSYSGNFEDAEWGYNRDGEQLEQVNLALVVSRDTRLPLWFRIIPGSIPDVSTLKLTCKMLLAYGLKDFICSLDRGYFSRSNLLEMLNNDIRFIIGVPLGGKQAKEILKKNFRLLQSSKRSFLYNRKRIRHIECEYLVKNNQGKNIRLSGHLFFDPERHELSASKLETCVLELEHKAKKFNFSGIREARDWLTENAGPFYKFFSLKYKDKTIQITKKNNAISKAMKNFGVTLIITTESDQSPKQILDNYRCKDIAEKIFDIAKNDIGIRRIRTGITHVASGKFFIAFIASILRLMIENKLRNANLLHSYSVDEALALLKKVKRIKLPDGTVSICEIPKKTRAIANALNITFNEI